MNLRIAITAALVAVILILTSKAHGADVVKVTAAATHKIVLLDKNDEILGMGTAFVIKKDDGTSIGVTNNHICDGLVKDSAALLVKDGSQLNQVDKNNLDRLNSISMSIGADVCFFTTDGMKNRSTITLAKKNIGTLDQMTVVGYPGAYTNVIPLDGRSTGSLAVLEPTDIKKCSMFGTAKNKMEFFMCKVFGQYVETVNTSMVQLTPNIGPGFSGSPVIDKDGEVVGIVARYMVPNEQYTNGHALMVPLSEIQRSLKTAKLVPLKDNKLREKIAILYFGREMIQHMQTQSYEDYHFMRRMQEEFGK